MGTDKQHLEIDVLSMTSLFQYRRISSLRTRSCTIQARFSNIWFVRNYPRRDKHKPDEGWVVWRKAIDFILTLIYKAFSIKLFRLVRLRVLLVLIPLLHIFLGKELCKAAPSSNNGQIVIQTDPLAWLKNPISCENFVDQVRARYGPLGKFSDLPEKTKTEIREVLKAACSEKFQHCQFPNCKQKKKGEQEPLTKHTEKQEKQLEPRNQSPREIAEKLLQQLYDAKVERERALIAQTVAVEEENKIAWRRFSVPVESTSKKIQSPTEENGKATVVENIETPKPTPSHRVHSRRLRRRE